MKDKFINIRVEMTRAGINVNQLANDLKITPQALYNKFNGKSEFTLSDMKQIQSLLSDYAGKKLTLEYLFGDDDDS